MQYLVIGTFILGVVWGQRVERTGRCRGSACAENMDVKERLSPQRVKFRAERQRPIVYSPRHKPLERQEAFDPHLPQVKHTLRAERFRIGDSPRTHRILTRAERQRMKDLSPPHRPTPEKVLYVQPTIHHRRLSRAGCEPPPIPHAPYAEKVGCAPPPIRHQRPETRLTCSSSYVPHRNFDRFACHEPRISHRSPLAYDVPCDAQRRGVMTATERLAHDLRHLFTNHKKHCEVVSAYSGVSIGEWITTQNYGRVPVAGYVMGWRVYVLAHYYDRKGRPLRKPRIERRKVEAIKHIEVWVPEPAKRKRGSLRFIKGLPGIEGFSAQEEMQLSRKRLSMEETKAIEIEKLVRKRQIAWLVRAYPEERVRLHEWLKKYAGPKPPTLWPSVDYRLLEIWQ